MSGILQQGARMRSFPTKVMFFFKTNNKNKHFTFWFDRILKKMINDGSCQNGSNHGGHTPEIKMHVVVLRGGRNVPLLSTHV